MTKTIGYTLATHSRVALRISDIKGNGRVEPGLAESDANPFPSEWYDFATADHFWLRWRIAAFRQTLKRAGLSTDLPWRGADIGCGAGVTLRQFERTTGWTVDGFDINAELFGQGRPVAGNVEFYDIREKRSDLSESYDFLILFDVIEHIEEPVAFLRDANFHLKKDGYVFVNVPAVQALYSRYDVAAGHFVRYDKPSLSAVLSRSGLRPVRMDYWGFTLLPVAVLRKLILRGLFRDEDVIRKGFAEPGYLVKNALNLMQRFEGLFPGPLPLGTSLIAIARKSG